MARITIPVVDRPTPDQLLLFADIRFLEERIAQRRMWSANAVCVLLQAAADVGAAGDPGRGREALNTAIKEFQNDVQTKNRLFYLLGALIGTVALALLTGAVIVIAGRFRNGAANLAEPSMVVSLVTFAGLGSLASVLVRLETIDLREEMRRKYVVISAAVRPLLAVAFASPVFVIVHNEFISIQGLSPENATWVAAFLCGFSERFGADLLNSVPFFGAPKEDAKPPAAGSQILKS